jgi:hypothetical protein
LDIGDGKREFQNRIDQTHECEFVFWGAERQQEGEIIGRSDSNWHHEQQSLASKAHPGTLVVCEGSILPRWCIKYPILVKKNFFLRNYRG